MFWIVASLFFCTIHSGCSLLATTMWIVDPNDVDAEYSGLVERRVVVVCEADNSLPFDSYTVTDQLAVRVGRLIQQNVEKVDVVQASEINDWTDHNELNSYTELGAAMQANLVVLMKLHDFRVRQGSNMLQGQAHVDVEVLDVASGELVHELEPLDSTYPPNNGIPADLSNRRFEERFRQRFVRVLADQVARRFYDHDSRADIKTDRFYQE
ncbi:MAG: hypothetical protein OES79_09845 [Planctomycetota bacterium]|nr:hypothetical protein [Planctomycetota bacterium]